MSSSKSKKNQMTEAPIPSSEPQIKYLYYNYDKDIRQIEDMLKSIKLKQRHQQALAMHPYPIRFTQTSGWYTNIDDPTSPNGKRKIRKCSEQRLLESLAEWYIDNSASRISIEYIFNKWIEWKRTPTNEANISRIIISWKSYYSEEPLSQQLIHKPVTQITSIELRVWAENLMRKHYPVDRKKFSRMFSIINNCYEFACDEDYNMVPSNLWLKARKKINPDLFVSIPTPPDNTQVFSDDERRLMKKLIFDDLDTYSNRTSTAGLQILLLLETGMRVGEICGLKWTDVKNGRLYVQRQARNDGVREWTKTTNGYRDIPLTKEALRILEIVKKFNDEHGFNAEWIFQSDNPKYDYRLSYNAASNKLAKLCKRMNTVRKSPHKLRKTCLSVLLDNPNVSNRTVQRFAGHSDISTTIMYYSFDRSSKEEQAKAINDALYLDDK